MNKCLLKFYISGKTGESTREIVCCPRELLSIAIWNRRLTTKKNPSARYFYKWGPVHTYPDTFESVHFSFRIRLSSTHIRWIRPSNPETFESALQSGNFWIRYSFRYVWTVYFRIRWRCNIGSSLYSRLNRVATKEHDTQPKCFCCSCWAESSWQDS